jgi:hypothetical protein
VRLEGLGDVTNPVTSSGIELATFQLWHDPRKEVWVLQLPEKELRYGENLLLAVGNRNQVEEWRLLGCYAVWLL